MSAIKQLIEFVCLGLLANQTMQRLRPAATQNHNRQVAGRMARCRFDLREHRRLDAGANLQVVIWATEAANPEPADFRALIVVTTDRQGYFSGPYPVGTFTSAHASIGSTAPRRRNIGFRISSSASSTAFHSSGEWTM